MIAGGSNLDGGPILMSHRYDLMPGAGHVNRRGTHTHALACLVTSM